MSDLISRQAAIAALEREKTYCTAYRDGYTPANVFEKYNAGITDGIKALKRLPPIDPVKHGKWIADKYTRKCSECKSTYWMREGNAWNYCPNCGAKNGGEG
ncbi:MAG: hypothetical protein IIZ42_00955 [Eubacterium sp.]|nr:hypothetical protein [Eubacterium sp.]